MCKSLMRLLQIVPGFATYGCKKQQSMGKMCVRAFEKSSLGGDVCPGDSGSPLVLWDGEAWYIIRCIVQLVTAKECQPYNH